MHWTLYYRDAGSFGFGSALALNGIDESHRRPVASKPEPLQLLGKTMPNSRLIHFSTCLATLFSLTHCGGNTASPAPCSADQAGCVSAGAGNSSTGTTTHGTATGGATSAGGITSVGATTAAGGSSATGGTSAKTSAAGGSSATGGTTANGGTAPTGGTSAKTSTGTNSVGGTTPTGGTSSVTTTAAATGGSTSDQSGVALAKAGDKVTTSTDYLNLGEIRLLNNRWGTDELNAAKSGSCNTTMSVNVNSDKSVGYTFNRGNCGDDGSHPDFPELEFGINPFGASSSLRTSPAFSSTTLLPIQIKDIKSASVNLGSFNLNIPNKSGARWDNCFEFWLSQRNPATDPDPGVYAEVIAFYTWETDPKLMWACDQSGSVQAGDKSYDLCHQKDSWPTSGSTQWRFFHFNMQGGPSDSFSGKVDAKAFLDWLVQKYNVSTDLWVTRFEVGTEFDDNTSGSVSISSVAFEVNSQTRSVVIAQ